MEKGYKAVSKQGQRVLAALRKMIASGELAPGERVAEIPISKRLGVSRMPIRLAVRALAEEGLLAPAGKRGFMVRKVTAKEVADAIEVRGALEGLAARLLAENGVSETVLIALDDCLKIGDGLFDKGAIVMDDMEIFHDMNVTFHRVILDGCGNKAIATALARNDSLPFASVSSIAVDRTAMDKEFLRFRLAHMQHHMAVDAIRNGQGARAESIMSEHANAATRYADLFDDGAGGKSDMLIENFKVIDGARA